MNFNDIFTKTFREGFAGAELGFLEMMLVYALAVCVRHGWRAFHCQISYGGKRPD